MKLFKHKNGESLIATNEAQIAAFKKFGFEVVEEVESDGVKPLSKMNKEELLAHAKENNIEVDESLTKKQIVEIIEATN